MRRISACTSSNCSKFMMFQRSVDMLCFEARDVQKPFVAAAFGLSSRRCEERAFACVDLIFGPRLSSFLAAGAVILSASIGSYSVNAQGTGQEAAAFPDFSGSWTRRGDTPSTFEMPEDGPHTIDTAIPHHGHCVVVDEGVFHPFACPEGVTEDRQSNPWIADISNPILQDWTREALERKPRG